MTSFGRRQSGTTLLPDAAEPTRAPRMHSGRNPWDIYGLPLPRRPPFGPELSLNILVVGSSPTRPTNQNKHLD